MHYNHIYISRVQTICTMKTFIVHEQVLHTLPNKERERILFISIDPLFAIACIMPGVNQIRPTHLHHHLSICGFVAAAITQAATHLCVESCYSDCYISPCIHICTHFTKFISVSGAGGFKHRIKQRQINTDSSKFEPYSVGQEAWMTFSSLLRNILM